ncbi:sigma-70 family RNA polymerase sigma factor [Shewanella mangrovi]|uniref:sigma-70 family RNA polymerase sigma factor n=1 Tax=Shewanella mangrovi TaxID=1515746 RepID=UPI001F4C7B35|nr:sigma-70 family RNA polymerase sigma factor [Shewanella mangrovi]
MNQRNLDEIQQKHQWLNTLLLQVAAERDKDAFQQIFHHVAAKIIAFGHQRLGSQGLAKDLLQETMTSVWTKAHLFDADKGNAITWIFTIMRNQCFDMLRKVQHNREDCLGDSIWPLVDSSPEESETIVSSEQQRFLLDHLALLPSKQRQVVQGIYLRELTHQQLAEELNVPVGTVKSRLRLALEKLRSRMEQYDD